MQNSKTILIAGGYGVVGSRIAKILDRRNPDIRILLGGRSLDKAQTLARTLRNATGVRFDVDDPSCLAQLAERPDVVIVAVNDLKDITLNAAIRDGIALIDVTRWTERVRDLEAIVADARPKSTVVSGSCWMACVPGALTLAEAGKLDSVDAIDISVLYALKDISGDNSVEYMDRLTAPFPVQRDGLRAVAIPYTEGRKVSFDDGQQATVYRFDSPDQHVLPRLTGAKSVAARIAFDDKATTWVFWLIIRSGLWDMFSGERFKSLRRGLMHNPGKGAPHRVCISVTGRRGGRKLRRTLHVVDDESQSHMTAVGAVLQAEWVLGLNGFVSPGGGLQYGEQMGPLPVLLDALVKEGVRSRSEEIAE